MPKGSLAVRIFELAHSGGLPAEFTAMQVKGAMQVTTHVNIISKALRENAGGKLFVLLRPDRMYETSNRVQFCAAYRLATDEESAAYERQHRILSKAIEAGEHSALAELQSPLWAVLGNWALEGEIERVQAQAPYRKPLNAEQWVLHVVWALFAFARSNKKESSINSTLGDGDYRRI